MNVVWTRLALTDVTNIWDYLNERSPSAAELVDSAILNAVEKLVSFPYLGRIGRVEETRELLLPKLQYLIVYAIKPEEIVIYRVLHTSQLWPEQTAPLDN